MDLKRITWRTTDTYSPLQPRSGTHTPSPGEFPPARERVPQNPDPYQPPTLQDREILRVTYQGDDRCQLRCPGCFTGERLTLTPRQAAVKGRRKAVPHEEFVHHLDAFSGLQDFFLIGAEPTMDPQGSAAKLRHAREGGLPCMSITNGSVSVERFEATFGEALDNGLYKINVSIDSMDPEVHDHLRGRPAALARTVEIVRHCLRRGAPLKVQFTVWPTNYPTILSSVEELYTMGVRGFAFHAGSVEGVTDPDRYGLAHVDPLAWRLLVQELADWGGAHPDLEHFNLPYLVFTEHELRDAIIGNGADTDAYLHHVRRMEAGQESTKPVHVCPALGAPQVYVFANDGDHGHGQVSLCNIHPGAYADYHPETRQWTVIQDPDRNQMQQMLDSPHLCPATPGAYPSVSDRFPTQIGDLYAACRYVGSNQMPAPDRFPAHLYPQAVAFYALIAQGTKTRPLHDLLRVCEHEQDFAGKTRVLAAHLDAAAD